MKLLEEWPREIGMPFRVLVKDYKDYCGVVDKNNGKKTLYFSLYSCNDKQKHDNCNMPHIFFDFDNGNAYKSVVKLHEWCMNNNLMHLMVFSGRKFHFYVFTMNYAIIKNRKACLKNSQHFIAKSAGLSIGNPNDADIDYHIIGDICRVSRVINSVHLLTKLYCIPISKEDLYAGEDFINKKAQQQCFKFVYYGHFLFDLLKFDKSEEKQSFDFIELPDTIIKQIDTDKILSSCPKCISGMLLSDYVDWDKRYHIITYFRDKGFLLSEINDILKKFLSGKKHLTKYYDNYQHCIVEERQLNYLYNRRDILFSCKKVLEQGLCIKGCKQKIYK